MTLRERGPRCRRRPLPADFSSPCPCSGVYPWAQCRTPFTLQYRIAFPVAIAGAIAGAARRGCRPRLNSGRMDASGSELMGRIARHRIARQGSFAAAFLAMLLLAAGGAMAEAVSFGTDWKAEAEHG